MMHEAYRADAMITLSGCDKTQPATLMPIARSNQIGLTLYGGTMLPGMPGDPRHCCGRSAIPADSPFYGRGLHPGSPYEATGALAAGLISEEEMHEIECCSIPGSGACGGMFTANTMSSAIEAMGMSLPGTSSTVSSGWDELNQPNANMSALFGLGRTDKTGALLMANTTAPITSTKRDLPYATPLDYVRTSLQVGQSADDHQHQQGRAKLIPAFGKVERLNSKAVAAAANGSVMVLGTFNSTGAPSLTRRQLGAHGGTAIYAAWFPSFSYMHPAISGEFLRPLDTCGEQHCNSQFIPSAFDPLAHHIIHLPDFEQQLLSTAASRAGAGAISSDKLVEVVLLPAPTAHGALLLLVNWQMAPSSNLTISFVRASVPSFKTATRASTGVELHFEDMSGGVAASVAGPTATAVVSISVGTLEYADAIMLRS